MYNTLYVLVGLYSRGSKSNEAETTKLNEAWPQEHTTDIIATSKILLYHLASVMRYMWVESLKQCSQLGDGMLKVIIIARVLYYINR